MRAEHGDVIVPPAPLTAAAAVALIVLGAMAVPVVPRAVVVASEGALRRRAG